MNDPDVFSADIGNHFTSGSADATRVRDVVVCTTGGVEVDSDEFIAHPPVGSPLELRLHHTADPVDLGRGVRVDRLSDEEANLVMNACTPRGHHFVPVRQLGQRFSFVRELDTSEWRDHPYAWDRDGLLTDALMLSRLIRDNAFSTAYAARVIEFPDRDDIVAYALPSERDHVYRVRRTRDWLDYEEAAALHDLLTTYWTVHDELPPRVRRAMWRTEYACWVRWGDVILPHLVSGLEALLKTERHPATHQFRVRVAGLAADLGVDGVTEDFCEEIYDARSDWVHGSSVKLFAPDPRVEGGPADDEQREAFEAIALLQDVLRVAVRRCIEYAAFRAVFADDDAIRARWPI